MTWLTTALSGLLGGRGFLAELVEAWKARQRLALVRHGYDTGGAADARALAEAIAIADGRSITGEPVRSQVDPPIQATAEREQPKAIEPPKPAPPDGSSEPVPPDDPAEPPP